MVASLVLVTPDAYERPSPTSALWFPQSHDHMRHSSPLLPAEQFTGMCARSTLCTCRNRY